MAALIAVLLVIDSLVPAPTLADGCHGLVVPPTSSVVRPYAPVGRWAGHWGVDVSSEVGDAVTPIGSGTVVFSGVVVRNRTVTVDHGGGIVTSYSYLARFDVARGVEVGPSTRLGLSSVHGGVPAYHLSLRIHGSYADPDSLVRCLRSTTTALYLATPIAGARPYPAVRARTPRRNLRPTPHRPLGCGECCPRTARC